MTSSLSLPTLAPDVPLQYTLRAGGSISAPLAIALIEIGMITEADLARHAQENALVVHALTRWWNAETANLTMFHWNLHVQFLDSYRCQGAAAPIPWFCITLAGDIPRFPLALRVGKLEAMLQGFGQTVLAVLEDAFCYLPVGWTLGEVFGMASYVYWMGEMDERWALEEWSDTNGDGAPADMFTTAQFFKSIPEWAALPRRVRSRAECESAASSALGKNVIKTCDAISTLVNSPGFILQRGGAGLQQFRVPTVEACAWLYWKEGDVTQRVVDDFTQDIYETGEDCDFISALEVPANAPDVKRHLDKMRNMLQLASLVEDLMMHLGAPAAARSSARARTLVNVFAEETRNQQRARITV